MARIRFHHYAWGLLIFNLIAILDGAFVRASSSGNGCGDHWPTCQGALIPLSGGLKTFIEFSHRASTGMLLPLILVLIIWAFRSFPKGHPARIGSVAVLGYTLIEALIGAVLVLFHLVNNDSSVARAIVMPLHLVTTLLLLMCLTLTAWWGSGGKRVRLKDQGAMAWGLGLGLLAIAILGVSGAITALGDTIFPAKNLVEGIRQDFAPSAHFLIALRFLHPLIATSVCIYTLLITGLANHLRPSENVKRFSQAVGGMFLLQMCAGLLNLLMLAPIWMQLVHLLLADLLWVSMVLLCASALAEGVPQVELSPIEGRELQTEPAFAGAPGWKDYLALTKPRVISLLLFTTLTAMYIAAGAERKPWPSFLMFFGVTVGFYMAAGAANAINMVLERDLDLRMGRTASRPTVTHKIPPRAALRFAFALMVGSFGLLWATANMLSAMLALAGLAFYVVIYTMLLKRRTWANIVIGGAAGAFPPLVGWAAVTNHLSPMAWVLFMIIFLWTPVHFWALAIMIKEDYARAGVPMLPVVRGERATVVQIAFYTVLTIAISVMPILMREGGQAAVGMFYLVTAALLNAVLFLRSFQLYREPDRPHAKVLFKYSMVYLALLFLAMAVDRAHWM
jgi:protoheme IX farnesyltransferase